ncbi:unnamed protein product, partial [Staurois parvus]
MLCLHCVLCAALLGRHAQQRERNQHVHADRREICIVYTQISSLSASTATTECWQRI